MRKLAATCLTLTLVGCATTQAKTGPEMTGVALGLDRVYLVGPSAVVVAYEWRTGILDRVADLITPCAELLDVEFDADELYILCADGQLMHASVEAAAELGAQAWQLQPLPELRGQPLSLQRSDHGLMRLEEQEHPDAKATSLDGPEPIDWVIDVDGPRGVDHWKRSSFWGPASSNASGDAFVFAVRLHRGIRLSLTSTTAGNAVCVLDDDAFVWPRDVAVDPSGQRFALLSDWALALVELDPDGSVRATVTDPSGSAVLRNWGRCHR